MENIHRVGKYIVAYYFLHSVDESLIPKKLSNTNANPLKGCLIISVVMVYIVPIRH